MRKFNALLTGLIFLTTALISPSLKVTALTQSIITRNQVEARALSMINLTWTYNRDKNGNSTPSSTSYVTEPSQFTNLSTLQATGIPYNWGGFDSIDSKSYNEIWLNFLDAVDKGAFVGNVNTTAGYGHISGTAGVDCSGFVQASYNIKDSKLSTSTLFNYYFTKISLSEIKHMDILDKPGDHVVMFDKWGTYNGVYGAFTYESTTDNFYGGIQGTKQYFMSMNEMNKGYIPGRYINIGEDIIVPAPVPEPDPTPTPTPVPTPTPTPTPVPVPVPVLSNVGKFAQIANVNYAANFRANSSQSANLIGTIPKGTILYLINYSSGWYQVSYNGQVGWVSNTLLTLVPTGKYVTVNNAYQLNIRNNPNATATIIGVLSQKQYAEVIGYSSDGNWLKISINGVQGYASIKYLIYIQ